MKGNVYRILGWLLPIICMAIGAYVLYSKQKTLAESQDKQKKASTELALLTAERDVVLKTGNERRYAAAEAAANEEELFLDDLRTKAILDGAIIQSWTMTATIYGQNQSGSADPDLNGLTKIGSNLEIQGPYGNLRKFLTDLTDSNRLFTVSNVTWNRANGGTALRMTLGRYVAPPGPNSRPASVSDSGASGGTAMTTPSPKTAPTSQNSAGVAGSPAPLAGSGGPKLIPPIPSVSTIKSAMATVDMARSTISKASENPAAKKPDDHPSGAGAAGGSTQVHS